MKEPKKKPDYLKESGAARKRRASSTIKFRSAVFDSKKNKREKRDKNMEEQDGDQL
jgi:hypothetical protein